jgi:hypothetical protein
MARLVGKIGVAQFLAGLDKDMVEKISAIRDGKDLLKDVSVASASVQIINIVLQNAGRIRPELYERLGSATGMTEAEIKDLPASRFVELLDAFVSRDDFWDFFMQVSRLISTAG